MNADDYGLTPGINRAVAELAQAGALTSATLMAGGACAADAVRECATLPRFGTGCHVVLVDGTPVLPQPEVPSLAPTGRFYPTLPAFLKALFTGRIAEADIEREAIAQMRRLRQAGVSLTHLDTHKHTHMFGGVLRPLLRAALVCGVRAIRNPFEPAWSLGATQGAGLLRRAQVRLLNVQRRNFLRAVAQAGLGTTEGAAGVLATGTLDHRTLDRLLRALPDGTWELVTHPGYRDAALDRAATRLRASREVEVSALRELLPAARNLTLTHFGALTGAHSG